MNRFWYAFARRSGRFIGGLALCHRATHGERLWRGDGFVLACTHGGHLEPFVLSGTLRRPVHWVARVEFFRFRPMAWAMRAVGTIPVDRRGVPVRAIRRAVTLLRDRQIVGIFPEGARTTGDQQVVRGGPLRGGAALLAIRAGVPIVPVVVHGTVALHTIEPWFPGRRTPLRTIVGEPIWPPLAVGRSGRRQARHTLTAELRRAFIALDAEANTPAGGRP